MNPISAVGIGFRLLFRRPLIPLAEIAWRWTFAAAAWLLGIAFVFEYLGSLPVTNADTLPQFTRATVLDTLVTSGLLTTRAVEASSSQEYEVLLEALIRELRFKAQRRGANGILALRVQLTPLTLPTDYRVTVTGTAVLGTP